MRWGGLKKRSQFEEGARVGGDSARRSQARGEFEKTNPCEGRWGRVEKTNPNFGSERGLWVAS
jgi:hypothetical protein